MRLSIHYKEVLFTHYETTGFEAEQGNIPTYLAVVDKGREIAFNVENPGKGIREFRDYLGNFLNNRPIVHWNQNKPMYGPDHLNTFLEEGESLLVYSTNQINLAEFLVEKYGDRYISHPRLNNLAIKNGWFGHDLESVTYSSDRLQLLMKIYCAEFQEILILDDLPKKSRDAQTREGLKYAVSMVFLDGSLEIALKKVGGVAARALRLLNIDDKASRYVNPTVYDYAKPENLRQSYDFILAEHDLKNAKL